MMETNKNLSLIRLNLEEAVVPKNLGKRAIGIKADLAKVIADLCSILHVEVVQE